MAKVAREECENCRGTGMMYPDCNRCDGNGWIPDPSDGGTMVCPECDSETCDQCSDEIDDASEGDQSPNAVA